MRNKLTIAAILASWAMAGELHKNYGQSQNANPSRPNDEKLPSPNFKKQKFKRNKKRGY